MGLTKVKLMLRSIFLCFIACFVLSNCKNTEVSYQKIQGNTFGTTFHIVYKDSLSRDFKSDFVSLFDGMNNSLSTYYPNSILSRFNSDSLSIAVDRPFKEVFLLSKKINKTTQGYFDPTIGLMVNAWGFGPNKNIITPIPTQVDSLMQYVGFEKVSLTNGVLSKLSKGITLDFNAIAKGYGVDLIAEFLQDKGIKNYLVEIGGEIRVSGVNSANKLWSIGIEEPNFDGSRSIKNVTVLDNETIATSGNYRKFKVDAVTNNKIAHTLNPKTGCPAETDLLSVSVISNTTCAEVDAYATAFMAMGYEKAKAIADGIPGLKVFFIYLDNNELKTYKSKELLFKI
ncbi:FAD:protein FMN transferase [Flavobacteriaceae bacterium]|nr:FAD:protein FMN transferase [Flavobacteriaceae bacterium]